MGGRLATYEDSGKVFLWRNVSSVWGRSYAALQKLDSPSFLSSPNLRRNFEFPRYRQRFVYWFFRRLFGNRFRPTREKV